MSSTNRGAERQEHDFYRTPEWAIDALMMELWANPDSPWAHIMKGSSSQRWLEPCAGDGVIIKTASAFMGDLAPTWFACEIRDERENLLSVFDEIGNERMGHLACPRNFLDTAVKSSEKFDLGLTNVPFEIAEQIVEHALTMCRYFITLQRLNWLETEDRFYWHRDHPSDHLPLSSRCKFLDGINPNNGKPYTADSCAYAWFIFGRGCGERYKILETPNYHPAKIKAARKYSERCLSRVESSTSVETTATDDDVRNGCSQSSATGNHARVSTAESASPTAR